MKNNNAAPANLEDRLSTLTSEQRELLVKRMNQQKQEKPTNLLVIKEGNCEKRRPLFCLHPPLGVTGYYLNIARYLPDDQPVYGIQNPSFSGGKSHNNMTEMAREYLELIRSVQPEPPYQIIGHSSGGFVAYEIARLIGDPDQLPNLFIADQAAPVGEKEALADAYCGDDLEDNIQTLYLTCWLVSMAHAVDLTFSIEQLMGCSTKEEKFELAGEFLKTAGFLPQSAELSMVTKVLKMIANHFVADTNYIESFNQELPNNKYDGNLVLLRSTEPTNWVGLDLVSEADSSPASGWEPFCSNPIDVINIPKSDHINLLLEPAVQELATNIESYLYKSE